MIFGVWPKIIEAVLALKKCLVYCTRNKTCLNGYEQDIKNIMVMEQLDRLKKFIDTELFNVFFNTEAPFRTFTCP